MEFAAAAAAAATEDITTTERFSPLAIIPNEILREILSYLPSLALVRISTVCRSIHDVIHNLLNLRIHNALNLDNHHLIFECYPPSAKTTTPYLHCGYLGTWRIDKPQPAPTSDQGRGDGTEKAPSTSSTSDDPTSVTNAIDTTKIGSLYSHFLPTRPPSSTGFLPSPLPNLLISTSLSIESNNLFTNLCAQASLVKVGPYWGLFTSVVEVFEEKGVRVQRKWLKEAENATAKIWPAGIETRDTANDEAMKGSDNYSSRILWLGKNQTAGLKFRVKERKLRNQVQPIFVTVDEEPAVTYTLYHEALLIRTINLLVTLEQSRLEQEAHYPGSGLAIILGRQLHQY